MVELSGKANKKGFAAFDFPAAALMEISASGMLCPVVCYKAADVSA
jgi:hypothetical protein